MDALWRLEIRSSVFLHGFDAASQQSEYPFEGSVEEEEDIQSACRFGVVVGVGATSEFQCVEHIVVMLIDNQVGYKNSEY